MKILLLIGSLGRSGAPKSISMLANYLVAKGYDVCLYSEVQVVNTIDLNPDIEISTGTKQNTIKIVRKMNTLLELKTLYQEIQPDVVVSFVPFYLIAFLKRNCKLVFSDRGEDVRGRHFKLTKILASFCDYVVFQTPYNAIAYDNLAKEKIRIIPNAIPPLSFEFEPYKSRDIKRGKISCTGRLHIKQKRQDVLIAAMELVHEKHPHAVLSIYGEGPDRDVLERQIADLNASEYVILQGFSKNISRDIYDSELFVLSSDYEGLPNSLIEAMQLELPCVSTDCLPGGARYLLEDGSGILVERENPKALADAICKLLEDQSMRHDLSMKAKDRVVEFSEKNIFQKWEQIWSK